MIHKIRRCTECKQVFATPDALRMHKRFDGHCRSVDAMIAVGYKRTPKGWLHARTPSLGGQR